MTELLARKLGTDNPLHAHAETVLQEAAQLNKLVGQFLSFARPFELELAKCNSADILKRSVQLVERVAEERRVKLEVKAPKALPDIEADLQKTAQALANIIRNAIEVSKPETGAVSVRAEVEKEEVVYTVDDNGPGIRIQEGENLFTPFFTKKEGGTGLGLSIVHRIITAHGGDVGYGNLPEGGAWFQVRMPVRREKGEQ